MEGAAPPLTGSRDQFYELQIIFPHTPAESKFFLRLIMPQIMSLMPSASPRASIYLCFWAFFIFPPVVSNILLIIFLGYWIGGGVEGAAPPPSGARNNFFEIQIIIIIFLG